MTPHRRGPARNCLPANRITPCRFWCNHPKDGLPPRDRLAAILVLVFGQQIEDVVRITWDQADLSSEPITLTIGDYPIELHPPLDEPLHQLHADPAVAQTAAHTATRWIFPGHSPGQHLSAAHLRNRIKTLIAARAARLGALHELTKLSPVPILAETLGYSPATIERHATASPRSTPSTSPHAVDRLATSSCLHRAIVSDLGPRRCVRRVLRPDLTTHYGRDSGSPTPAPARLSMGVAS